MRVRALALWTSLAVAGCGSTTEIVLVVDSDLHPSQVGTFWIRVSGTEARCFSVEAAGAGLPLTLGLVPSAGEQEIEVTAAALAAGVEPPACTTGSQVAGALVAQRARARFVTGERRVLLVTLERACADVTCDADSSCREGRCQSVDRALEPWTGELPRIPRDAGTPGMDAAIGDAGLDAGARDGGDEAGVDASADAGDAGRDGGGDVGRDAGPCDGGAVTAHVAPVADTQLANTSCLPTGCGGSIGYGDSEHLNIGATRVLLRYPLPVDLPAAELGARLVAASVRVSRLRDHPDCSGCAFDGNVEARPMRNDWIEGTDAEYSGAEWCRVGAAVPCVRWAAPGADAVGTDVAPPASSIFVPSTLDVVDLPMRVGDLATFASAGQVSVQLRGARPGGEAAVVFLVPSTEGSVAGWGTPPLLVLTYCPP